MFILVFNVGFADGGTSSRPDLVFYIVAYESELATV